MRKKDMQLINIARNQLNMDEDTYRLMLNRITGKSSLKEMTDSQLIKVKQEMGRLGFKAKPKKSKKEPIKELRPQLALICILWDKLATSGIVNNKSQQGLNRFIKRMTGIEALEWLNSEKASAVIEHLKQWLSRAEGGCNGRKTV